jgi:hypothetical protein
MKKNLLSLFSLLSLKALCICILVMLIVSDNVQAQIINEGFEESIWATSSTGTHSTVTVNEPGTASINNGTWVYSTANVNTVTVASGTKSLALNGSSASYIITPVITAGVTQLTLKARAATGSAVQLWVAVATNTTAMTNTGSRSSSATGGTNAWSFASSYFNSVNVTQLANSSNGWAQLLHITANVTDAAYLKVQRIGNGSCIY